MLDKLMFKDRREKADRGNPRDFTRELVAIGGTSVGSWSCTKGGWDSPTPRTSTETFYVLDGAGYVTDPDGIRHSFGSGDVVVLPKGWYGRWGIIKPIHKVWVLHEHANEVGVRATPIVIPVSRFAPEEMYASSKIYEDGNTRVGFTKCSAGVFPVDDRPFTESFHVLEGDFTLTNADEGVRRCKAGDTVVLPKGWSGQLDVIRTLTKVWVET